MSPHDSVVVSRLTFFDPSTPVEVEFELTQAASVSLFLFDGEGKEREKIIDKRHYVEGTHRVKLAPVDYRREDLFYRLVVQTDSDCIVETKKITTAT